MIHERGVNVQFPERKLHLVQFVKVHPRGELTHRDGKERRFHGLGHDLAERRPGASETENANFVFGIVRGLKKWEALDVVPVRVSNQQRQPDWLRLEFSVESDTERPDARARIEHNNFAVSSYFYAGGIPAVTQSLGAGHRYRATCAPKLNSCRRWRYRDAWHGWRNADFAMHFQLNKAFSGEYLKGPLELLGVWGKASAHRRSLKENRDDQDRENVDDLDHRIDRRAGGIFVRIADRVTGNCRLVREGTFASKIAFLNELLGVVPRAASGGHGNRNKEAGDNRSHEQTPKRDWTQLRNHRHRHHENQRQQRRHDHFAQRRFSHDVHARPVLRRVLPGHDAGMRLQLPSHFADNGAGGFAHCVHAERGEDERKQSTEEQADNHLRIGKRKLEHERLAIACHVCLELLYV